MDKKLIELKDIILRINNKIILNNISLDIFEHDFVTIVGPNAAGKTMLLRVLIGLVKPDQGKIVRNSDFTIGYVPQRIALPMGLPITVQKFIMMKRKLDRNLLEEVIIDTNIKSLLKANMADLSPGELQRVLLARSLLRAPKLLILDEPAQNMDITGQMAFYKLLEKIYHKRNCSIVMVSHDLHLVMSSSKKVICLFHHICCSGKPEIVAKDPKFIEIFGEDMAKMMTVYHHTHDHSHSEECEH